MPSDETLVQQARRGIREAFDVLVERHMGMVYAIAWGRLGDPDRAEDLAQEVFLRAFLSLDQLRNDQQFTSWLSRIARNLAISWLRRDGRISRLTPLVDAETLGDLPDSESKGARQTMETQERDLAVRSAIANLAPDEREALLLHFAEELSPTEIAKRLGVHQTTISRRLQRALDQMRGLLEPVLRETAPALRPSRVVTSRTLGVIAAAAAMSATSKAALAAKSTQDIVALTQGSISLATSLKAACAAVITGITIGGKAMATGKGIAALVGVAALVGGGVYLSQDKGVSTSEGTVSEAVAPIENVRETPEADQAPTAVSGPVMVLATVILPDGTTVGLPALSREQMGDIMQDRSSGLANGVREGLIIALPRDVDFLFNRPNSRAEDFQAWASAAMPDGFNGVGFTVSSLATMGPLMSNTAPRQVQPRGDDGDVWEVNFAEPLDEGLLFIVDMRSMEGGLAVVTESGEMSPDLMAQLRGGFDVPARVSRARADMRALATGIESFFIDNNRYPVSTPGSARDSMDSASPLLDSMPTFSSTTSLTSPIAYMSHLLPDPFINQDAGASTYSYCQRGSGWILVSPGPDGVFDIDPMRDYAGNVQGEPTPRLQALAYDPTNGIVSGGDIFRIKQ